MTHIPIIDTSPIGDQDGVERNSGALGSVAADVAGTSKKAKASFEKALNSWENGPRRALFQHAAVEMAEIGGGGQPLVHAPAGAQHEQRIAEMVGVVEYPAQQPVEQHHREHEGRAERQEDRHRARP